MHNLPTGMTLSIRFLACWCCCAAAVACADSSSSAWADLSSVVVWGDTIHLEENDDVINVTPVVELDPRGGFLIADDREGQLRRYSATGRLLWHAGRKGSGPGEFRDLLHARRLPSGEVLGMEWNGRATVYDSSGGGPVRTLRSAFANVEDILVLDDSLLLVSGFSRETGVAGPRLHIWNPARNEVLRSFFTPQARSVNSTAAGIVTWTKVVLRGDTIAAVFALGDSVHFFDTSGTSTGSLPISFSGFRRVSPEAPPRTSDPVKRAQWLSTFDYVSALHWLQDGRFLIIYQTVVPAEAMTRRSHLFMMDRTGIPIFEVRDAPRLLTADPRSGQLYFVAESQGTPNRWSVAHLRP